ncbi:MAG: hypothetical protein P0Y65_05720 [Candidatus Devosia phytovorans]|uniref:Uncharacterized protein n=1 Tax=Candidatus Devosia phytovorans TaxID=3121372 RepID=A0AAJ6B2R8_9HYPH|nr:hypothetical protein [Devosia sp.]WEK05753.1 MAG: hypothetical protein P0Y65_05720 [Devosia sp.]
MKRTKSGAISRAAGAYNENADAIALRMRVFGLSEKDARDQKAATFIGRLCMAGRRNTTDGITEAQYEAATEYLAAYANFQKAVKSPNALRTGSGGGDQGESADYDSRCRRWVQKFEAIQAAVQQEQGFHENRGSNMWAAIDYLLIRDEQHSHMIGDLRLALNAVGHHLGIIQRPKRRIVESAKAA